MRESMNAPEKLTYQFIDRDCQGFSRRLDCTLKSRKPMKSYKTPKQLAAEFDVSETCIYRWCRTGYFRSYKVGGHWRIDSDVEIESLSNPMNGQIWEGMRSRDW